MDNEEKGQNFFRSVYPNIMVLVGMDVYHLDQLQLALKSDYFERILIHNFHENERDLTILSDMDSETFSVILDIIYDVKNLESVLTGENCVSLLIAMDYLQMRINTGRYLNIIENHGLKAGLVSFGDACRLLHFISVHPEFRTLWPQVLKYLALRMRHIQNDKVFLSLSLDHLIEIIHAADLYQDQSSHLREFSQNCVNWICDDLMDNRSSQENILKLVNAAKRSLRFLHGVQDEKPLSLSNNPTMKREKILSYFYRLLLHKGDINMEPLAGRSELTLQEDLQNTSSNTDKDGFHDEEEQMKLSKFLENGYFYDITVQVEDNGYRLHRFKLAPMCGYFADFPDKFPAKTLIDPRYVETPGTWIPYNKNDPYLVPEIDCIMFETIIEHIYFDRKVKLTQDNIVSVLKASSILEMKDLDTKCAEWLTINMKKITAELAVEIFNIICGNVVFENFSKLFFHNRVPVTWPEMADNEPLFRSISIEMLEDVLVADTLHFPTYSKWASYFCFDRQGILLDICSKWVMHDVKNRSSLIPRIALAINCNGMKNYDDHEMKPVDFDNCTHKFVRDELWSILCSTLLVPQNMPSQNITRRNFMDSKKPAFISLSTIDQKINILNVGLELIASMSFSNGLLNDESYVSATMIENNIFFALFVRPPDALFFHVYNLPLNKFISLSPIPKIKRIEGHDRELKCTLLNCSKQIYCCFENGDVLKYSMRLNRWARLSRDILSTNVRFATNGKTLYRMYKKGVFPGIYSYVGWMFDVQMYDLKRKVWKDKPDSSLISVLPGSLLNLTCTESGRLAALFQTNLHLTNLKSWSTYALPTPYKHDSLTTIVQSAGVLLYLINKKLYGFYRNNKNHWNLKGRFPSITYDNITAIAGIQRSDVYDKLIFT